jgi:hypothetical protein
MGEDTCGAVGGVYLSPHSNGAANPVANQNGGDDKIGKAALHRVWPTAAIGLALAINLAWIGILAYGLYKLF